MNTRAWIAVGLAVGLAWTAAAPVLAEESAPTDVVRAEAYASDAFNAYSRQDYAGAVALYQEALQAAPSADILYNLARIYDTKLKDRGQAIEYYQRYTLDTGADPNRLRVASGRLAELRQLETIATVAPAGSATAPVAASVPKSTRSTPPSSPRERGLSSVQIAGLVTGALGVAGMGIGVGFGLKAKSEAGEAEQFCDGNACTTQGGVDASHAAKAAATVSTIAFVAGGALTLLGVTALLLGSGGTERELAKTTITPYGLGAQLATRW